MKVIGEEHDIDFLAAVVMFGTLTVWPNDSNKINATCRLEKRGLVSVRRVKRPESCCMHVTATIPAEDNAIRSAIAGIKIDLVSVEITVRRQH